MISWPTEAKTVQLILLFYSFLLTDSWILLNIYWNRWDTISQQMISLKCVYAQSSPGEQRPTDPSQKCHKHNQSQRKSWHGTVWPLESNRTHAFSWKEREGTAGTLNPDLRSRTAGSNTRSARRRRTTVSLRVYAASPHPEENKSSLKYGLIVPKIDFLIVGAAERTVINGFHLKQKAECEDVNIKETLNGTHGAPS